MGDKFFALLGVVFTEQTANPKGNKKTKEKGVEKREDMSGRGCGI